MSRVEDLPLLLGTARFTEDIAPPGAAHAVFVRSAYAHGRLLGVDTSTASAHPSVVGVFTGADLGLPPLAAPSGTPSAFSRPLLAEGVTRFAGEPVAVVVAETRAAALDTAELVVVNVEPLSPVVNPARASGPEAPLLFPDAGTNVAIRHAIQAGGDVEEGAEVRIAVTFVNQRLAPAPMEANGCVAVPAENGSRLTVWVPCQSPFWTRSAVADALGMPNDAVRVVAPAVGGAFGGKIVPYPEQIVVAALAMRLGRPVRYVETRTENLVAMTHGRAQVQDVELMARRDGRITGLKVRIVADLGAYPSEAAALPGQTGEMLAGAYEIPRIDFRAVGVVTNTTPVSSYRGAGRPEAAALIERIVDMLAAELEMDPAELRRRNLIGAAGFPHTTVTGVTYDSGDYAHALDEALSLVGYGRVREEQARRRAEDCVRQIGAGIGTYVEATGFGSEYASVEVLEDGSATVRTGTTPQGQGHATAFGRIVASTLHVPLERVRVIAADTGRVPRGEGTMGSRSLQVGGSAVLKAGNLLVERAKAIASADLEVGEADLVLNEGGRIEVTGAPDRSMSWEELVRSARERGDPGSNGEGRLWAEADFDLPDSSYPFGTHVAVVEVDTETGRVRLLRYVAVDDCGRILNPALVEGQLHGGIVQGIGQALWEGVGYDESGNPATSSFVSYTIPTATELPTFETVQLQTPTDRNPLRAKGVGEAGAVGAPPAVQNAVIDAVAHLGVRHIDMPLAAERIVQAIRGSTGGRDSNA